MQQTLKRISLIIFAVISGFVSMAQDAKPTKEETIAFLNKMAKQIIGEGDRDVMVFKDAEFNVDSYYYDCTFGKQVYENINWEGFREIETKEIYESSNIVELNLTFSNKIKGNYHEHASSKDEVTYYINFDFIAPRLKVESITKAFYRLKEIAEQESIKDPFEK